jgi:hypothetical protein
VKAPLSKRNPKILSGWKEIAEYLGKGVRTVQRYEEDGGLPVRRPSGHANGSVIATTRELDAWIAASPLRKDFKLRAQAPSDHLISEFKIGIAKMGSLRREMSQLRTELHESVEALRKTISTVGDITDITADDSKIIRTPINIKSRRVN